MKKNLSLPGGRILECGVRPLIMGIVNLTPDSFYASSRRLDPSEAADRALEMLGEGAGILDFGAESTRPGSLPMDEEEEMRRLIPALRRFRKESDAVVSIDTRHGSTARAALDEGADIINDISALRDPSMAGIAADHAAGLVLMHMRGDPQTMQDDPLYGDCAAEVADFLFSSATRAKSEGISAASIVLDPGIGFGKTLAHNLELLARLYLLSESEYPVLVGLSRKRFVGELTGRNVDDRLSGSLGAACAAWTGGADIFRVHDVAETADALKVFSKVTGTRTAFRQRGSDES